MHKYIKIYELKCICKAQAEAIKNRRIDLKKIHDGEIITQQQWDDFRKKYPLDDWSMKRQYRRYHIAHCLLRGKTYEQIENKVREENKLKQHDWNEIEKIRQQYYEAPVEYTNATDALEAV